MRVFWAFLIIFCAVILWMLPFTDAAYAFLTEEREDTFNYNTAVGQTTANVTLLKPIYDDDTATIGILSSISDDSPAFVSYNVTSRLLQMSGLADNTTRVLYVTYDVQAQDVNVAIDRLINISPVIWLLSIIVFPIAGIAAIWFGRA